MRKSRLIVALSLVALLTLVLAVTHEKNCHFNVHLTKRLYCTEPAR